MKVLITGICGFVGSHIARYLIESVPGIEVLGLDSLVRPGSETNRLALRRLGVKLFHGDVRMPSDLEAMPAADWVVDAAAQPSVLAGRDGRTSTRQLLEHNLLGSVNILEYCRNAGAGLVLLSTSRVYSIPALLQVPLREAAGAYVPDEQQALPAGVGPAGVREDFSTGAPISLYGATKLASEQLAQEYAAAFNIPVWINRCGVLAGPGQFGTAEQGIFSYWIHAHSTRRPLKYLGFGGHGYQVRDALHPQDLARLVSVQIQSGKAGGLMNVSGGQENSMSLANLNRWCDERFGEHQPVADGSVRAYDIPWLVLDSARVKAEMGWQPEIPIARILDEIAEHAALNPQWLSQCGL